MKYANKILACAIAFSGVSAFAPNAFTCRSARVNTGLSAGAVVTGPGGKAASSKEEDMRLTLQIIMAHDARSATVTEAQFASQMEVAVSVTEDPIDVSIPYDSAAQLAYDASDKSMEFEDFKTQYLADAVALVKSKQPKKQLETVVEPVISKLSADVSIPYDAAAKLAFDASDKSMAYADFKVKYEADAVASVIAKRS